MNPYLQSRIDEDEDLRLVRTVTVAVVVPLLIGYGLWHLGAWLLERPFAWWCDVAAIIGAALGLVVMGLGLEALERAGDRRRARRLPPAVEIGEERMRLVVRRRR